MGVPVPDGERKIPTFKETIVDRVKETYTGLDEDADILGMFFLMDREEAGKDATEGACDAWPGGQDQPDEDAVSPTVDVPGAAGNATSPTESSGIGRKNDPYESPGASGYARPNNPPDVAECIPRCFSYM